MNHRLNSIYRSTTRFNQTKYYRIECFLFYKPVQVEVISWAYKTGYWCKQYNSKTRGLIVDSCSVFIVLSTSCWVCRANMGRKYCVICKSTNKNIDLSFHAFPKSENRKNAWTETVRKVRDKDFVPKHNSYVCSVHFFINCWTQKYMSIDVFSH